MNFKDIWKPPFHHTDLYIFSSNNVMTYIGKEPENICNLLNDTGGNKYNNIELRNSVELYTNGKYLGTIRGWGHLTGSLRLDPEKAAIIQDLFIEWILKRISNETEE